MTRRGQYTRNPLIDNSLGPELIDEFQTRTPPSCPRLVLVNRDGKSILYCLVRSIVVEIPARHGRFINGRHL